MQDPRRGPLTQMPGGGAPAAPRPGTGAGNVPYAKGMISGFGAPPPQRTGNTPPPPMAPAPQASSGGPPPPSGGPGPGGPPSGPVPPGPGQSNPFLDPQFTADMYGAIMAAIIDAAESGRPILGVI